MQRALELANRAVGRTSPNPAVGAVVVSDGLVVGEGFTQPPGSAHAEVVALAAAGQRARGAELYVTLEPCCHFGRTPPCTDAIVASGIRSVHAATLDPNPLVNGNGVDALRRAEVQVDVGNGDREATRLNAAFLHYIRARRPFVTAKWAMTLDGKTATRTGDSRWITSPEARRLVHQERDASDAIVVGIGTALADDPALTVRLDSADCCRAPRLAPPWRVVIDSQARLPRSSKLVRDNADHRTIVFSTNRAPAESIAGLVAAGAEVVVASTDKNGKVDLKSALQELGQRGAIRILVEGGGELTGALFEARLIDRVLAFVAPKIVGGGEATTPVGSRGIERVADAVRLVDPEFRFAGPDLLVEGRVAWPE